MKVACKNCALCSTKRISLLKEPYSGEYKFMFLVDYPDTAEDATGEPFFGFNGRLLNNILKAAGLHYNDFFVSYALFCRPTNTIGGATRNPTDLELLSCKENVIFTFEKVKPRVTVFVGEISKRAYSKIMKPNISILAPTYLAKTGGMMSPHLLPTVAKLKTLREYI